MQKEILVMEVKQLEGGAFNVKDAENTGYFCRDAKLLPLFQAGGPVIIVYEQKTSKAGKPYNNLTEAKKKGQPDALQPQQTASATKPVEVSGPEYGGAMARVMEGWVGGKLKDDNPLVLKMLSDLHRIMGTSR